MEPKYLPSNISAKQNYIALAGWSLFSFSLIMLGKLFSLNIGILAVIFNVSAIGYIFYYTMIFESFPSPSRVAWSMLVNYMFVFLLTYSYLKIIMLRNNDFWLYEMVSYLISNLIIMPISYLILLQITQVANKRIR